MQLDSNIFKAGASQTCRNSKNRVFIQYNCEMSEEMQSITYDILCKAVVITLFYAFLYSLLIYYMQRTAALDRTLYDVENVTASDYTVEMDISAEAYRDFEENQWPVGRDKREEGSNELYSEALYCKKYLQDTIPGILCNFMNSVKDGRQYRVE